MQDDKISDLTKAQLKAIQQTTSQQIADIPVAMVETGSLFIGGLLGGGGGGGGDPFGGLLGGLGDTIGGAVKSVTDVVGGVVDTVNDIAENGLSAIFDKIPGMEGLSLLLLYHDQFFWSHSLVVCVLSCVPQLLLFLYYYHLTTLPTSIALSLITLTHSHTLLITGTYCYDQIKGTQDTDFSYSFSDSLSLIVFDSLSDCCPRSPSMCG